MRTPQIPHVCSQDRHYHVAPRYTCGSPGQVDLVLAAHVAGQELEAYKRTLDGIYGEEDRERAKTLGLRGIAYATVERRGFMFVEDLIVGAWFAVPLKEWSGKYWYSREDRDRYQIHEAS